MVRSIQEGLACMRVESFDLSPLERSTLQAEDKSGILKPKRGVNCLKC